MNQIPRKALSFLMAFFLVLSTFHYGWLALAEASYPALTNLPTLYITLDNGASTGDITKETQLPGVVNMAAEGYEAIVDAPITIKGRGNSTWTLPKKPYQIKFTQKTDMLGMGASKKWILLANYWDKTLMRNHVTYNLAQRMGMEYTTESRYVDVVINGQYQGNYLLTEKVELGGQRIDEDELLGSVLFELEVKVRHPDDSCDACIITRDGVHATIKDPEPATPEELATLQADCANFLQKVENSLNQGYEVYSKYIDVPSFIDWYIVNELAKNFDAAFWTSTYCYRSEKGVLHMGPVWDVDVCYGNQDVTYPNTIDNGLYHYNYRAEKGAWYLTLFQDETFVRMLKERWKELLEGGYFESLLDDIDRTSQYLAPSQAKEQARWPDAMEVTHVRGKGTPYFTYRQEVEHFKNYIVNRVAWLDTQWGSQEKGDLALYDNTLLSQIKAESMATSVGRLNPNGTLTWDYSPDAFPNAPIGQIVGDSFFSLDPGEYYYEVVYRVNKPVFTDYFMLECQVDNYSTNQSHILQTPITHVTYATGPKTADGYGVARLYFTIDPGQNGIIKYRSQISAYNAAEVTLKEVKLYQVGEKKGGQLGDINQDQKIDAADALKALQYAVKLVELTDPQKALGDVNRDGDINASDALRILQYAVNLISSF